MSNTFQLQSTTPQNIFYESDGAVDSKYWRLIADGGNFLFQILNDSFGTAATIFSVARSGASVGALTLSTTQMLNADGSSSNPGYAFANDADIGMYRSTSNTLSFTAGGSVLSLDATELYVNAMLRFKGTPHSTLSSQANGTVVYCTDCTIANPCASGGSGALAKRINSVWVCN
jgi:hypothetical protein